MKLLILSNSEWDDSNSFGSSFSSIFGNLKDVEIANIYCREGKPNTKTADSFFQITEKMMIKNLINPSTPSGKLVDLSSESKLNQLTESEKEIYNYTKSKRWFVFIWIRELIWLIGRWKSKELNYFIKNYNPDIIFLPIYYSVYLNKIGIYLSKITEKPIVGYISDDCYTLRQYSLNPFYWIERLIKRHWVKKSIKRSKILYVISDIQKHDYDRIFHIESKLLYKGNNFDILPQIKEIITSPIKLVYTGNIGDNRWKVLNNIGEAIHSINDTQLRIQLYIYSKTQISNSIKNRLQKNNSVYFMGGVDAKEIPHILNEADVLVHVEPTDLKGRLQVRQSFSTKIVDYLHAGGAIFAVGWKEAASIDYLVQNDAALVAFDEKSITEQLQKIVDYPEILNEYAQKAWECGKRNHQIDDIQKRLYDDLSQLITEQQ